MEIRRLDLKLLQDSFWRERVFGFRELSEEKIHERMQYLDLHLDGPSFCVVLFAPYLMEKNAIDIDKILMNLIHSVRDGYHRAGIPCYTISDNYCNVVAVVSLESEESYRKLVEVTLKTTNELIGKYDVKMFAGVGEKVGKISELNRSKNTASEALAYKFSFSENNVISARDVKRYYHQGDVELKKHYDQVMGCFYDGNLELMTIRLNNLFSSVTAASIDGLESCRNVCIELTASLHRVVREMGILGSPEMHGVYTNIAHMQSVVEIQEWFLGYCSSLLLQVNKQRMDKTQQILLLADRFIEEKLGDPDLSVQMISDYVDLSAPYFSNIFYKAKGIHISEYINQRRVQAAKRMLSDTNDKVVSIAQRLGFSSPNYFNSVFKRYTGLTPSRYRDSVRK